MKKFGLLPPVNGLSAEEMSRIIDGLFPVHEEREADAQRESGDIPLFTRDELRMAIWLSVRT